MLSLRVPPTQVPINLSTLTSYILPPIVCGFVMAVLAVIPHTRSARVALWPIIALLAFRASISVDMSSGKPERKVMDAYFLGAMFDITTRTLDWTLTKGPLVRRYPHPTNGAPSIIMDALDLYTNFSGYGWDWSHRVHTPQKTRSDNRVAFALSAFVSAVAHTFVFGISHRTMLSFAGTEHVSKGFTIFDETLPFFVKYFRASIFGALTWILSYTSSQAVYQLGTMAGVLLLRQDITQWPPAFDAPWRATSLGEFWGRRWHQWCRRKFLFLGGYPLSVFLGGRPGIILGGFLASAVLHDILLVGLAGRDAPWGVLIAYCIMATVVLAEYIIYRLMGRKVGGVVGWTWTMTWLLLFAALMTDGWARAGGQGDSSIIDVVVPLQMLVERVVTRFDAWLRAV